MLFILKHFLLSDLNVLFEKLLQNNTYFFKRIFVLINYKLQGFDSEDYNASDGQ